MIKSMSLVALSFCSMSKVTVFYGTVHIKLIQYHAIRFNNVGVICLSSAGSHLGLICTTVLCYLQAVAINSLPVDRTCIRFNI